jgi:hypothetical protein
MATKHEVVLGAEGYIARANRRIKKHRSLTQPRDCRRRRDLVDVLTAFRANVEVQQRRLDGFGHHEAIGHL